MRIAYASTVVLAMALLLPSVNGAPYQDADKKVAGGGISVPGWQGKADKGESVNDSKFVKEGNTLHLTSGPAAFYWNPADTAKGNFTVKATFREPKQTMSHPHPFGVFIGGSKLDSDQPALLYCVAYRDGSYLVRGFSGGTVMTLTRKQANPAVHKTAGPEEEVTQEVAWSVKDGRAECSINGTVVGGFAQAELVGPGKLESIDGIAGIRVAHNTDVYITNFGVSK